MTKALLKRVQMVQWYKTCDYLPSGSVLTNKTLEMSNGKNIRALLCSCIAFLFFI